jgi:YaiO family outer membrane protein
LPAALILVFLINAPRLSAQTIFTADLGVERSSVDLGQASEVWTTETARVGAASPLGGGWSLGVERQSRDTRTDVFVSATGYRRLGAWTLGGGIGGTPDATFLQRVSVNGEVSRATVGTLVASIGYRYLDFSTVGIHQAQPRLTWYNARGEVGVRGFVTRNPTLDRTSVAVLATALVEVHPRVRLGMYYAVGDRIFDVSSFVTPGSADSWLARGIVRVRVSGPNWVEVGGGVAREAPSFSQTTIAVAFRRGL